MKFTFFVLHCIVSTAVTVADISSKTIMTPHKNGFADLVTFTEEILNGKLHFLRSVRTLILIYSVSREYVILKYV